MKVFVWSLIRIALLRYSLQLPRLNTVVSLRILFFPVRTIKHDDFRGRGESPDAGRGFERRYPERGDDSGGWIVHRENGTRM